MKVLIADGSPVVTQRLTTLMLEIPDVRVLAPTATGEATLRSIRAHDPEVLILDARILRGKQRDLLKTVRKEKSGIVVIILSNLANPQYRKHYEAAGADLFLDKSNEFIHLFQFVRELVRSPQTEAARTRKDGIQKRIARTKLRVGLQLSLLVFAALSLFVGPRARGGVPWLGPAGGEINPYSQSLFQTMINAQLSAKDTATGTYRIVGYKWWQYYDDHGEESNWGLFARRDNGYDGLGAVIGAGMDSWGYPAGGEQTNYDDFLDDVTGANLNVYMTLHGLP